MKRQLIAGLLVTACASPVVNASQATANGIQMAYGNQTVEYGFADLPKHTEIKLNFDLFILDSWDGEAAEADGYAGFDVFGFRIDGAEWSWTFRNVAQSPDDESNIDRSWETGNFNNINTWGEIDRKFIDYADGFTIAHTGNNVDVEFFGTGLQEITDESWRVSNVSLTAVPVPATVWLFGSALLGLAGARRKVS